MAIELKNAGSAPKPDKKYNRKTIAAISVTSIVCVVLLVFGIMDFMKLYNTRLLWREIQDIADNSELEQDFMDDSGKKVSVDNTTEDPLYRIIDFDALRAINADVSKYIYVPGTNIDYPVLKETEPYAYYYQSHDIYGHNSAYGSIFELCDEQLGGPEPTVNYLFGHHMASGDMFTQLNKFEKSKFANETPIYIYTPEYREEYKAVAVCVVDKHHPVFDFGAYSLETPEYQELLDGLASNSEVEVDMQFDPAKRILVLSTCKGRAGTSNRLIVVCVKTRTATLIHKGE